jgi:hypothetical protein
MVVVVSVGLRWGRGCTGCRRCCVGGLRWGPGLVGVGVGLGSHRGVASPCAWPRSKRRRNGSSASRLWPTNIHPPTGNGGRAVLPAGRYRPADAAKKSGTGPIAGNCDRGDARNWSPSSRREPLARPRATLLEECANRQPHDARVRAVCRRGRGAQVERAPRVGDAAPHRVAGHPHHRHGLTSQGGFVEYGVAAVEPSVDRYHLSRLDEQQVAGNHRIERRRRQPTVFVTAHHPRRSGQQRSQFPSAPSTGPSGDSLCTEPANAIARHGCGPVCSHREFTSSG